MRQRNDDAVHTDRLGRADERAEVLRVVQRIKQKDERLFVLLFGMVKDLDLIAVRIRTDLGDDALIVLVDLIQLGAFHFDDWESCVAQPMPRSRPACL